MTKEEIQQRVLKHGKPLDLSSFNWDSETKTFSSNKDGLVVDFKNIHSATIKCGDDATIKCGSYSTIKCGDDATIDCGSYSTIKCGDDATIDCGSYSTIKCGYSATIKCGSYSTIKCGGDATIKCGSYSTIDCGSYATIDCGYSATIKCGSYSTIKCGGEECAIVNRNVFEVITPNKGDIIQICPYGIKGHLVNGMYNGEPHIIVDGILSKVIFKKKNVYKVINHGETKESYIVQNGELYAHGYTIKEAKESLIYKIIDQDTSAYEGMKLTDVVTLEEGIKMYRKITGSCESQTKAFVKSINAKDKYTIKEIIELTKHQYGNDKLKEFFETN